MKREPAKNFQDLIVWQKAHQFVLSTYRFSSEFPKTEVYGLTSQLRRAAFLFLLISLKDLKKGLHLINCDF
jgi:hypothetical protein